MSNIIINNKEYNNVPSITFNKVGGGTATYTEGGGGGGTTIEQLNVSAAGTYTAPTGTAYSPVVVPSGTEGTPTATKGTVSSHSVTVTPSVTNTGGYISGSTKTGTAVTVSASELVSGTKSITSSGTTDVTNYANASVASGSATTPTTTISVTPSISVSSGGLITATASGSESIAPTVSAGYVSSGTSGTVSVSGSNTSQLSTQGATTITPTTSSQTAVAAGKYTTGAITVDPIPSQYIIPTGTISITGAGTTEVTNYASASVPSGSVVVNDIELDGTDLVMSASVNSSGLVTYYAQYQGYANATLTSGYVSNYTSGYVEISGSNTYQLATQSAQTITPTKSVQTIAKDRYLTGVQTIAAIPSAYQDVTGVTAASGDVVSGKSIVDSTGATVNGSLVVQHYYTGSGTPSSSTGVDGDIYLKTS